MKVWNIGYPKWLDYQRWRDLFSGFESGQINREDFSSSLALNVAERWKIQHELGLDSIPLNDFGLWDRLLETAWLFGLVPKEAFSTSDWMEAFFLLTKGNEAPKIPALPKTKWFKTSYTSFAPIWDGKKSLQLHTERIDWEINLQKKFPYPFHFSLIGPWTLSQLCRLESGNRTELLSQLMPLYDGLMKHLKKQGFDWVQLEEPSFCGDLAKEDIKHIHEAYSRLPRREPKLVLSTYYESFDPWLSELCDLPVQGVHFDCVNGPAVLSWLKTRAFPKDKALILGVLDAKNIWASPLASICKQLEIFKGFHPVEKIWLAPSAPLWHLPETKTREALLKKQDGLYQSISFARERIEELVRLKKAQQKGVSVSQLEKEEEELRKNLSSIHQKSAVLQRELNKLDFSARKRGASFAKRSKLQKKKFRFPVLPLLCCGFTKELSSIEQEKLELDLISENGSLLKDLLVGFIGNYQGVMETENGWIPSCGNFAFKPALIVSDIIWGGREPAPVPQNSETNKKPKKVSVLGPGSVLATSFCRQDLAWEEVALQLGFAIRQEIKWLETYGYDCIELWEGELATGSPTKKQKTSVYQKHLLDTVKLASAGVKDETMIFLALGETQLLGWEEFLTKTDTDVILLQEIPGKPLLLEMGTGIDALRLGNLGVCEPKLIELTIRKACQVIPPRNLWVLINIPEGLEGKKDQQLSNIAPVVKVTKELRKLLEPK